jgi:hypothetical protein
MVDVAVNFTLGNEEPVNAEFQVQPDVTFTADIKTETSTRRHEELINRDLPDQHPISAITGLQEILNQIWTFTFEQGIPSDTWVIQHNLGRNPSVTVVDSAGAVQIPDEINYDTDNQITVKFLGSFAGKAFLN